MSVVMQLSLKVYCSYRWWGEALVGFYGELQAPASPPDRTSPGNLWQSRITCSGFVSPRQPNQEHADSHRIKLGNVSIVRCIRIETIVDERIARSLETSL